MDALLNQTNLWDSRKKSLSTYSGGMKQRFGIAQALLPNPRLIIVDEPTAGLDPAERNRFLNLLSSIGRDVTVILSTHIVDDVRELCPRMAISTHLVGVLVSVHCLGELWARVQWQWQGAGTHKAQADGNSVETRTPLSDYIQIGVFVVDRKPRRAGIDPYNKLIDRIADDNMINIDEL